MLSPSSASSELTVLPEDQPSSPESSNSDFVPQPKITLSLSRRGSRVQPSRSSIIEPEHDSASPVAGVGSKRKSITAADSERKEKRASAERRKESRSREKDDSYHDNGDGSPVKKRKAGRPRKVREEDTTPVITPSLTPTRSPERDVEPAFAPASPPIPSLAAQPSSPLESIGVPDASVPSTDPNSPVGPTITASEEDATMPIATTKRTLPKVTKRTADRDVPKVPVTNKPVKSQKNPSSPIKARLGKPPIVNKAGTPGTSAGTPSRPLPVAAPTSLLSSTLARFTKVPAASTAPDKKEDVKDKDRVERVGSKDEKDKTEKEKDMKRKSNLTQGHGPLRSEELILTPAEQAQYSASQTQREAEERARRIQNNNMNPLNLQEARDAYRVDSVQPRVIEIPGAAGIATTNLASHMVAEILARP